MNACTKHACVRMQQRAIPPQVLDWLILFGETEHVGGAELFYFNKRAIRRLEQHVGRAILKRIDDLLDTYAVVNGETVVTAGHRYRRVWRKR